MAMQQDYATGQTDTQLEQLAADSKPYFPGGYSYLPQGAPLHHPKSPPRLWVFFDFG
jgi:hypothetical protein